MSAKKRVITRRDFMRTGSRIVMGSFMGFPFIRNAAGQSHTKSRVVLIRDQNVTQGYGSLKADLLIDMLDQAVTKMLGASDPTSAWREIVKPTDIVGIKSNVWWGLSTPDALEDTLINRLMEAGVSKKNIAVDDRGVRKNPIFQHPTSQHD